MHGTKRPLVLTILDGWGYSAATEGNAIAAARKPTYDLLLRQYPNTLVQTSGPSVGLPEGQMGNSEVGHLNIGAGRVIYMDVTRIDRMIASGEFFNNPVLLAAMQHAKTHRLHLMGLCSDGGVHSLLTHLYALLEMAKKQSVEQVFVHCFMDGRDTPPESGAGFIEQVQKADAPDRRGQNRDGLGPLLRHGSRQALGAHGARLQRDGARQRRKVGPIRWPP